MVKRVVQQLFYKAKFLKKEFSKLMKKDEMVAMEILSLK